MTSPTGATAPSGIRVGTAADVAALLLITRRQVYRMVTAGELPVLRRVGSEIRFDMDAIERWLRNDETPPTGRTRTAAHE